MQNSIEQKLNEMTRAEKAAMLAGADMWRTMPQPRLQIPSIKVTDGPNGARGADDIITPGTVCFPVGVALGATWNVELVEQVGRALADEVKAKQAHMLLAPTVNIPRTPLAGRNFECYAEDPYLSGMLAAAYINGLQGEGISACIKHFVCNDQEFERFSISAEIAARPLHEIYLEPFRIALEKANPWSVMSAYNRINGVHASEHEPLLRELLKGEWQYDGVVLSDWFGTYSDNVPGGGLDLEMPGPARYMAVEKVLGAVEDGRLPEAVLDDKVRRLLRLIARVDAVAEPRTGPERENDTPASRRLARRAAAEAIVLLKNEGNLLPLDLNRINSIAVIGENGQWAQIMGGGSSAVNPYYAVSPLDGIRERVGDAAEVEYALGTPIHRHPPLLPLEWLRAADGETTGLTLEYFGNMELAGKPVHTAVIRKTFLSWFGTVNPYIDPSCFSLRLSGTLTVPAAGSYTLNLAGFGKSRLWLDDELVIDNWRETPKQELSGSVTLSLEAGRPVSLVLEFVTDAQSHWRMVRLGSPPVMAADPIQEAVDLAARVDVPIIVAGLTGEWESEGFDRPDLELVGAQSELIVRVAAVNPRTIVLLNVGSPVTMPWLNGVPAVLQTWYLGQETGNALADLLFGDTNPSGRLPVTIPRRLEDNPAFINFPGENGRVQYGEGIFVGYRYYDKKQIEPLFPFGHGLSYTTFEYANLRLNGETFSGADTIEVAVDLFNRGPHAGKEVVQLYVQDETARVVRPERELKAFAKVELAPGERKTVRLQLNRQSLAFYDTGAGDWVVEDGRFHIAVGASSRDLRLHGSFLWTGEASVESTNQDVQLSSVPT